MSKKISVHVDLMKSDKELDEIVNNCTTKLNNFAMKAANNYEKQLLQFAIRNKAKQVYVVRKMGINVETSCWEIDCQFFTDKEVACEYARMNKPSYTHEIIGHELGQLANIPDDVFESIPNDGNKELAGYESAAKKQCVNSAGSEATAHEKHTFEFLKNGSPLGLPPTLKTRMNHVYNENIYYSVADVNWPMVISAFASPLT